MASDTVRVMVPVTTRLLLAELAERRQQSDVELLADLVLRAAVEELQRGEKLGVDHAAEH